MYYLMSGETATREEIEAAYNAGKARLVHSRVDGRTMTGLILDGTDCDTRGRCFIMRDEVWTTKPESLEACLENAHFQI